MTQTIEQSLQNPRPGDPVWGISRLFPQQGGWSVAEYLALDTNVLVEYANRSLEFPPMPSIKHQWIVGILYRLLFERITERGLGSVFFAPTRVRVDRKTFREPDVLCVLEKNVPRIGDQCAEAADLVVEVVSPDDPGRDWDTKRAEYAAAGIAEYWIADPRDRTLTILGLEEGQTVYQEIGRFAASETAHSALIDGLAVEVAQIFTND